MIELINQFGGKKDLLLLFMFVVIVLLVNSFIKNRLLRVTSSILLSVFIIAQTLSLYFTQSFIGYQFYVHANLRGLLGLESLFIIQILATIIFLIILIILNIKSYDFNKVFSFFQLKNNHQIAIKLVSTVLLVFIIVTKGSFISDTKTLLPLFATNNTKAFNETLLNNNMPNYVTPDKIEGEAGKNIIVISMESLEKGLLNKKYAALTPNLNKLKNKWHYFDLKQNLGSGWTSGSLYTSLTGFPALFGASGNSIFHTAYHSDISSITHVLQKTNYNITYMNGNTDHSGIKEMLNVFKFDKIIDYKNSKLSGFESYYGLRDKDLFNIAKKEVELNNKVKKPFALFISTTDTHFPNGIYDKRMEAVISPKNTDLEFTIAALDYLIGDFITFLETKNILENTTIYLFPDHLKMGDPTMFNNTGERSLYCITNSNNISANNDLYQIDLPKIILKGANVNHNLKFLTDYLTGDKNEYIKDNMMRLTEINTSGILNSNIEAFKLGNISKHYNNYKKDTLRFIAHAGGEIDGEIYTNSLEALNLNYEKGFRLFELDIIKTKDNYFVASHDWEFWAKTTGYKGELPVSKDSFLSKKILKKYTPLDMKAINKWFKTHPDAILVTDKINDPKAISEQFIDKNRLIMELFTKDAVEQGLNYGIRSAMPSQSVVNNLKINDIERLAKMGVKNIAISRRFIKNNKTLLKEFKKYNIKPFAYHINSELGIDEDYVTKYEMDYIYGIYADKWSFK